jgi:16S rRNA (cytosine1402-N4)-methyltransferase
MKYELVHKPILVAEVITGLAIKEDGVYVDATFGRGGHVREILRHLGPKGRLFALDKDPAAVTAAKMIQDDRLSIKQGSFTLLQSWMQELGVSGEVDGIVMDLGVASPQLDDPKRGFSFLRAGPLDMRMDPTQGTDAARWINSAPEEEIATVLKVYGEERFHRRIAAAIVQARTLAPINTTKQLADIAAKANPKWEKYKHPATRTFQAIRIFINNELEELKVCLEQCLEVLAVGGRLAVISFHSLEDRIVKRFMQKHIQGGEFPAEIPLKQEQLAIRFKRIGGAAIKATSAEIASNIRARSAVLRIVEKIA